MLNHKKKKFRIILEDANLPKQVMENIGDAEAVFECLKDKDAFRVDCENHKIFLNTFFIIGTKKK